MVAGTIEQSSGYLEASVYYAGVSEVPTFQKCIAEVFTRWDSTV